jgi:8-oxo-dGTP diphosphatase
LLREVASDAERAWPQALAAALEAKAATLTPRTARPVEGAGGVVWNMVSHLVEVVLVHRRKHSDWSLPKGEALPGESAQACALREVEEETGLRCRLGQELTSAVYRNQDGRTKLVRYWAMTRVAGILGAQAEVDEARWLPVSEALRLACRERDVAVLGALQHAAAVGNLMGGSAWT